MAIEIGSSRATVHLRRMRRAKRALVCLLCLVALCSAAWLGRGALLRGAAELWIVSDEVRPADAVAVFGGGTATRPFAAAEYYRQGLVKKILLSSVDLNRSQTLGGLPSPIDLDRAVLFKLGVPETAIESFGTGLRNTYEEAVALREWAARNHASRLIVPTEMFSSRRVRWVLKHEFSATDTQVNVPALDEPEYATADWWRNEKGIVAFQNEVIKYMYYRIKY